MKWLLIIILLAGSEPEEYVVMFGDDEAKCKQAKAQAEKRAKEQKVRIVAACHSWTPPPEEKPKGDPATEKRS